MPKIGAHVSMAGGIIMAPKRAYDLGCETFQCFTRSPQGGPAPIITESQILNFKSQMLEFGMETFYIHTPYYINFASLNPAIRHSSAHVVREELERGTLLGAKYVMTHLGSHASQTLEEGIEKVIKGIARILDGYKGTTELLLEISAGAGNVIGDTFDEIGQIMAGLARPSFSVSAEGTNSRSEPKNLGGICFDTCHAFASGYDFRTSAGAKKVLEELDKKIGLEYLKLTHVNDSKFNMGGKRDRHEHIGDGFIGKDGMAAILSTKEFGQIDWLLETDDSKRADDIEILKQIRQQ